MDNNEKFNSINDLYKRLLPALQTRMIELRRENFNCIDTLDIWNYCANTIWRKKSDLRIYELVSDILNVDGLELEMYVRKNLINYKKRQGNDDER